MRWAAEFARNWRSVALVLGIGSLVLASLVIGVITERAYWQRRTMSLAAQADVLANTATPALVFQDAAAAQESVAALMADEQIERAAIYDATGQAVASASAEGRAAAPRRAPADGRRSRNGHAEVVEPVTHEGQRIGSVLLETRAEPGLLRLARHAGTLLFLLTSVVVLLILQQQQQALRRALAESEARAAALQAESQRREVAEEALRQAQKMETLGQLTGGIAHDFNNLLQGVQGALELIARKPGASDQVAKWAKAGLEGAERGRRLTAQLLAFSRAQKLELQTFDVSEVAERLQDLLPGILGSGMEVVFERSADASPVVADATQLELAVINLCVNARDAMPDGGRITISTRLSAIRGDPELEDGDYLLLSVADTGVGMPADVRARAFEPFFTTKGVGKGTGLGLAQVYGIARQAGGTARIASESLQGTTVTLYLPRASSAAAPAQRPLNGADEAVAALKGARILAVDDDAGVLSFVAAALESLGHEVRTAGDGPGALAILEDWTPDLIMVDYAMPGMTGAEVAGQARELHPQLPVLFMSGYAETDALTTAVPEPVRLLRKPFDVDQLSRAVNERLENAPPR